MEVFIARQPVFTIKKEIFGYELLFRQGVENICPIIDGDIATSHVLSNTFISFELNEILDQKPGLINFTRNLILQKVPLLFAENKIIVEVLEDIEPDKDILNALEQIKAKGFNIALDDFIFHEKFKPMIDLCTIIKFDLMATPLESLGEIIEYIKSNWDLTLLAEKVETYEEFKLAKKMGFTLFQGFFFAKPEMLSKKEICVNHIIKLELISMVSQKEVDFKKIEYLIKNDVSLSYRLLKFINSPYFRRTNPVSNLKDAITFLGTDELKKFINMAVLSDLCEGKPHELVRLAVIRAYMCEKCASVLHTTFSSEDAFTLGLFSIMEAVLDQKMENIIDNLAFDKKIKSALLGRNNEFNKIMDIVTSFEKGSWENNLFQGLSDTNFEAKLPDLYLQAVKTANSFF